MTTTMMTVLTKEMYKMNRREQCASKQNDDDKAKNNPMVITMMAMKWHSRTTVGYL